jgi:hypothetical protein
VRVNVV